VIVFTFEVRDGVTVVDLAGAFEGDDAPALLVDHLEQSGGDPSLVVDLTGVGPIEGPAVRELVLRLEAGPAHHATVLIHEDLASRRQLRSMSRSLPVVPDVEGARRGRFFSPHPAEVSG